MKSNLKLSLITTLCFLISCNREMKFNPETWHEKDDGFYTKRELMVNDLMKKVLKTGLPYGQIILLLGTPDYSSFEEDRQIHYEISEKYKWNVDPEEIRYLDLKFDADSTLIESKIRITR